MAIGLIGAATLLLEILLTRIFSVTMWYHFAFIAISLALFGIAASGAVVTAARQFFCRPRALHHLGAAAAAMGVSVIVSFLIDLQIPFIPFDAEGYTYQPYLLFTAKFLVLGLPFFFSGLVIALAFTHAASQVHRTYFFDLVGGGLGCFLVVPALLLLSGPTAVIAVAALPLLAAALFFRKAGSRIAVIVAVSGVLAVVILVTSNILNDTIRITRVKAYQRDTGQTEEGPLLYERWHPVSRVAVHPITRGFDYTSWFYSREKLQHDGFAVPQLLPITNDAGARTYLFPKDWGPRLPELFRRDLTDLVFYLTSEPDVLVVGVGGGKDILSALALDASSVTGVELNPLMIDVVQREFSDFTGAPYDDESVKIVIDEGRNYLASRPDKYDVIKISVTDTWTAGAMGAYALTENYLYTIEAMRQFLSRLEPGGYLSIIRWYPHESLRLVVLAATALAAEQPHLQIAMARSNRTANVIVKNGAFTPEEIVALRRGVEHAGLVWIGAGQEMVHPLSGDASPDDELDYLHRMAAQGLEIAEQVPFSVAPPTDDSPFFFSPVSVRDAAEGKHSELASFTFQHGRALSLLYGMLQITLAVAAVFVIGPLLVRGRRHLVGDLSTNVYFMMLGFGFLLVEIPLLQRFILFLGHPTYAVTVVLFSLLISSGVGSLLVERVPRRLFGGMFAVLLLALLTMTVGLPSILSTLIGLPVWARVVVSFALISPLGLLLGMPFPLGLRELHRSAPDRVPWAWAVNGAASVGAPVVAMILAIESGFSTALYLGTACYAIAGVMMIVLSRQPARRDTAAR